MEEKFESVKEILKEQNQEHILNYPIKNASSTIFIVLASIFMLFKNLCATDILNILNC